MLTLLALLTPIVSAAPERSHLKFQADVGESAAREGLTISQWGSADLDGDGRYTEAFALLCDEAQPHQSWLVFRAKKGDRWVVDLSRPCDTSPAPPSGEDPQWSESDTPWWRFGGEDGYALGIVGDEVKIVQTWSTFRSSVEQAESTTNYVERTRRTKWSNMVDSSEGTSDGALVVVETGEVDPPPTLNRVLSDEEKWKGPADAAISVGAHPGEANHVRLTIRLADNVTVPLSSEGRDSAGAIPDRDWQTSDHVVLWWCRFADLCSDSPEGWQRLQLAWTSSGVPMARWISRTGEAAEAPKVWQEGMDTFVSLPHEELVHRRGRRMKTWKVPFTVVFSDVDKRGAGIANTVATSDLIPGNSMTTGLLVRHDGNHFFPPRKRGTDSIRKLKPSETTIRSRATPPN